MAREAKVSTLRAADHSCQGEALEMVRTACLHAGWSQWRRTGISNMPPPFG